MVNEILSSHPAREHRNEMGLFAKHPEKETKKRIKIYITPAVKKNLEKNARRCECPMMFICRMAWICGHETFQNIFNKGMQINQIEFEKIETKKAVPIYIDVDAELKRDLQNDADILKIPLSQYLRVLLDLYLKNLKVKE